MPDELHQPLGQARPQTPQQAGDKDARDRPARVWSAGAIVWGVAGGLALAAGVYAVRYGDPAGGLPRVVARIEPLKPAEPVAAASRARDPDPTGVIDTRRAERQTGDDVERNSGVKVTRAGNVGAPGALIIQLDEPTGVRLAPAPDKRLIERDRFGPLPRIGADGAKSFEVYARPLVSSQKLKSDAPRIALIVGGLGLSTTTTQSALDQLPADVSFAFAPYGADLPADVSRARDRGHEVFLQAPMEPFDYPQNDPGPHTLTVKANPDDMVGDLRWLMTRFTGYVGVINFLGARFTSSEAAITPFLRELAQRGVAFVDDGSSPQSLAAVVGASLGTARARADLVIDADQKNEAIEAALTKLETIARQRGSAIGVASAIPHSIERLGQFARGLEQRGVALVPASAMLARTTGPQAENRRP